MLPGLRRHLLCTLGGLQIGCAPGAKANQRQTLPGIVNADSTPTGDRPRHLLIGDRNDYGKDFERTLTAAGVMVRSVRRILAMTAAISHTDEISHRSRPPQGPVITQVTPGYWTLMSRWRPSAVKEAPASSLAPVGPGDGKSSGFQ